MADTGMDPGRMAQINAANAGPAPDKPKNMDDLINSLFEMVSKWAGKMTGANVDSLMKTGVLANADLTKVALIKANANIGPGLSHFDAQGGTVVNTLADGIQIGSIKDFSKIAAAFAEAVSYGTPMHVSDGNSGQLASPAFVEGMTAISSVSVGGRGGD